MSTGISLQLTTLNCKRFYNRLVFDGYPRNLEQAKNLSNYEEMANALNGLGAVSSDGKDLKKSISYHKQALEIRKNINDLRGVGGSLHNLGVAHFYQNKCDKALKYYNEALKIFEKIDLCLVSNKESENYLKILGSKNIKNYGNLKFSSIKNNLNKKLDSDFLNKIKNRKIWCAASTHPTEEILCAKSHLKIKKNYNNILTIIIPRHIDRVKKINEELYTEFIKEFEIIS